MKQDSIIVRFFLFIAVALTILMFSTHSANAESVGEAREKVRNEHIKPAQEKAAEAKSKAQESTKAKNEASQKKRATKRAKEEHEKAKSHNEKLKTEGGKAEIEKEANENAEKAKKNAEAAKKEAEKAKKEAEKAEDDVKKVEEEAKKAMSGGNVSEMEKKLKELEEARKRAKEAEEKAKKAEEEAKKAEEKAKEAEKEKEESLDPEKAEEKEKEAKEKAEKAEKEEKEAEEKAKEAAEKARKAKEEAKKAKDKAKKEAEKFKKKFGKKKDKIDKDIEELDQMIYDLIYYQVPSFRTTSAAFVALDEKTAVNEEYFGKTISYAFYAVDDREIDEKEVATITKKPDGTQIIDLFNPKVVKIAIIGTLAKAIISGRDIPGIVEADSGEIISKSGDIRINPDGSIKETISVGDAVEIDKLQDHEIFINDSPVDIVAARENEISIDGYGFAPSETISDSGTVKIELRRPDGTITKQEVPCWMANINMEPVTRVGSSSAIRVNIEGVPSNQVVDIHFMPEPGQKITPQHISARAGDLKGVIASVTVSKVGPQRLNAIITRGELQDRPFKAPTDMTIDELQETLKDMRLENGARMLQRYKGEPVSKAGRVSEEMFMQYGNELQKRVPYKGLK